MSEISQFRKSKDGFFADDHQSPLTPLQKSTFTGLKYFPENSSLRLELLINEFEEQEEVQFQTSTGDVQEYVKLGLIRFEVDGKEAELTVFFNEFGLFLPFVDSQAGKETYGAGRYLEPTELPNGNILVDFNLAYNPYCAYNDLYSCPLTPWENRLSVPIRAGEKIY